MLEKVFQTMTWMKMVVTDTCCRSAFLRSSSSRKKRFLLEPCRCCLKALAGVTAARPFRRTSECHCHFHLIIRARNASTAVRPGCRRHNKSPLENADDQPRCGFRLKPVRYVLPSARQAASGLLAANRLRNLVFSFTQSNLEELRAWQQAK